MIKDGWLFPWGGDPDPDKANYYDTGIGATSAVGCFPKGKSDYGMQDMVGNTFEWCATKWEDDYQSYRNDNNLDGKESRAVRGGAFYSLNQWRRAVRLSLQALSELLGRLLHRIFVWWLLPGFPLFPDCSGLRDSGFAAKIVRSRPLI